MILSTLYTSLCVRHIGVVSTGGPSELSGLNPTYARGNDRDLGRGRRSGTFKFREKMKAGYQMEAGTDTVSTLESMGISDSAGSGCAYWAKGFPGVV